MSDANDKGAGSLAPENSRIHEWFWRGRPEFRKVIRLVFHPPFSRIRRNFIAVWVEEVLCFAVESSDQSSRDHVSETSRLFCVFLRRAYLRSRPPRPATPRDRGLSRILLYTCIAAGLPTTSFRFFSLILLLLVPYTNDRRAYFIFLKSYLIHEGDWFICAMMHACLHYQRAHHIFPYNRDSTNADGRTDGQTAATNERAREPEQTDK